MTTVVRPSPEELLGVYQDLLPQSLVRGWVKAAHVTLYWRLLTPLVILWGFIFQRLNADHTCDAAVSHFHTGAADGLAPVHPTAGPLSRRLTSESTSAYVQGRNRLPLAVLQAAVQHVYRVLLGWLQKASQPAATTWKGHALRWLDGTTFRLAPTAALLAEYTPAVNQTGRTYWIIVRSVAAFCGFTQAVVGYAEAVATTGEVALVRAVLAQDPTRGSLYGGDRNFGTFRVAQVARASGQHVLLRLNPGTARLLFASLQLPGTLHSGADYTVAWAPQPKANVEPDLPLTPVPGRLLYARLQRDGFRPMDLYLFTTLQDQALYPLAELVALYARRWEVEIDYRHLKTSLEMAEFTAKSPALFRKELAAGLLTYNLICALMTQAALQADLAPTQLSFRRCYRRIRAWLIVGLPAWVDTPAALTEYLLTRLARCTLPQQPHKVQHEPRRVRRRPAVFPALKGSRDAARQQVLRELTGEIDS